jgi:hypothetical protein
VADDRGDIDDPPCLAFIMPRMTARDSPKTAFRSVSMTVSQSSSFRRMARLSRVMPALLTSTVTAPKRFLDMADQRIDLSRIAHFEDAALALAPRIAQTGRDFRRALRAGGRADHGGTKRAQFERDGLTDAARGTGDERNLSIRACPLLQGGNGGFDRRQIGQRNTRQADRHSAW